MKFTDFERKIAELALVGSIGMMCKHPSGRYRGLCEQASQQADGRFNRMTKPSHAASRAVVRGVQDFQDMWRKSTTGLHPCTYVNFVLAAIDNRPWPEIKKTLIEIVDYFDRVDRQPAPAGWAGVLAQEKFESIFAKETNA